MPSNRLQQPIQARISDDELSEDFDATEGQVGNTEVETDSENGDNQSDVSTEDESHSDQDGVSEEEQEALKDISFGALAKAQEAFAPPSRSKKRKISEIQDDSSAAEPPLSTPLQTTTTPRESKHPQSRPNQPIHRSSKHAPTILSSKHPVSRKRQVFEPPPTLKSRDPRFDAAIKSATHTPQANSHADKNYSFLTTYQTTEVLSLKTQLKKTKDPTQQHDLKRQIMSLESKIRNAQVKQKEREILRAHGQAERQAIRQGAKAKPYFLKQSDVRKQIEQERVDAMGKNARDKMEKRKIKKQKGKDGRDLPRFRRSADG